MTARQKTATVNWITREDCSLESRCTGQNTNMLVWDYFFGGGDSGFIAKPDIKLLAVLLPQQLSAGVIG